MWCRWDGDASGQSRSQARPQWEKPGENEQGRGQPGHRPGDTTSPWCQQPGHVMKHLGCQRLGRGHGAASGEGGWIWGAVLEAVPAAGALPAPALLSTLRVPNTAQSWEWELPQGCTAPTGSLRHHSPQGPLLGGTEVPLSCQHPEVPKAGTESTAELGGHPSAERGHEAPTGTLSPRPHTEPKTPKPGLNWRFS